MIQGATQELAPISLSGDKMFNGRTLLFYRDGVHLTEKRMNILQLNVRKHGGASRVLDATELSRQRPTDVKRRKQLFEGVTHLVTGVTECGPIVTKAGVVDEATSVSDNLPLSVVRPEWVSKCIEMQSIAPEADFAVPYCLSSLAPSASPSSRGDDGSPLAKRARVDESPSTPQISRVADPLADFTDLDEGTRKALLEWGGPVRVSRPKDFPKYACERPAVYKHPNRHITSILEEIQAYYDSMGDKNREVAFGRSLATIRAWPRKIRSKDDIKDAPFIGGSVLSMIKEILEEGISTRLGSLKGTARNRQLVELCTIHGVGHFTAEKWLRAGYTSVRQIQEDLEAYGWMAIPPGEEGPGSLLDLEDCSFVRLARPSLEQLLGVKYHGDYTQRMSRAAVEKLGVLVRECAEAVLERNAKPEGPPPRLLLEICGGYRRGKEANGDADVLVSCWDEANDNATHRLLREGILQELKARTEFIPLKESAATDGFAKSSDPHERLESHDNMLGLCKMDGLFRRLDVIIPPPDQWAFCVLGWSGTKQMEKDLRDYAKDVCNMSLSQQALYDRRNGLRIKNPRSPDGLFHVEEDIFHAMGIKFLPPCLRWA